MIDQPKPEKSKACRRLIFDDIPVSDEVTEEETAIAELTHQTQQDKEIARLSKKYNFDFLREVPLEGNYQWVRVEQPVEDNPQPEQPDIEVESV